MEPRQDDTESRARNAARDVANSMIRFKRDWARMQRAMGDLPRSVQRKALAQGCDSPERAKVMGDLLDGMEAARAKGEEAA